MKPPSIPGKPPPDFQSVSGAGSAWRGQALLRGELYFDGSFFQLIKPEQFSKLPPHYKNLPEAVRSYFQSFQWLVDLRTEGSPSARLLGRAYMVAWGWRPPQDFMDDDPVLIGGRLLHWVLHYEYFMGTAPKAACNSVLSRLGQEGRLLSSLLPGEDCGSRNLTACAGLLATYLVFPSQDGFLSRYERFSPEALESALLPGGCVVERNPLAQLNFVYLLYRLWEIHLLLEIDFPLPFKTALSRSATSLAALIHGDGGLSIFNGSFEGNPDFIQTLLRALNIPVIFSASSFHDGFVRLEGGEGLVIIDAGRPVEDLPGNPSHAGILSFEFSYGKTRIFSNMGAGLLPERQKAWRQGPSHNLIVPNGKSCLLFKDEEDFIYAPRYIQRHAHTQDKGELVILSHDFYRVSLGGTWERQIFLSHDGNHLRGEEFWYGHHLPEMLMRFHLHPDIEAVWEEDEIILRTPGMAWRFSCEGGVLCLDNDLYLGRVVPRETRQIVIHSSKYRPLEQYSFVEENWETDNKKAQPVFRWYLERVPV